MVFKKNKIAQLSSEYIIIIVSLVITGIVLFFISNMISNVKAESQTSIPQINYEYPLVVVHSFLQMPLNEEDKKEFENENNINYVKDLFWINSKKSKKVIEKYKTTYVDFLTSSSAKNSNSLELFNRFSESNIEKEDLLYIIDNIAIVDLDFYILETNSAIPIKKKDGGFSLIHFRSP